MIYIIYNFVENYLSWLQSKAQLFIGKDEHFRVQWLLIKNNQTELLNK